MSRPPAVCFYPIPKASSQIGLRFSISTFAAHDRPAATRANKPGMRAKRL
jgi:hypothetical protein